MPVGGFTQLTNNIMASISRTESLLGFGPASADSTPYPLKFASSVNSNALDQSNWNRLPLPYTFSVVDRNGTPVSGFTDFELPLAPQNIMQTEMFATSIKPTQGGTVVTHSGNKYKALKVSGTTGIAPFRGQGGVSTQTGEALFSPGGLKFKSGYEVFIELRNYFKAYYEFKNTGELNKNVRLVWKNYKDGEFLVVELMSFNMKRSAGRSFLYDYDLDFKVLRAFEFTTPEPTILTEAEDFLNNAANKIEVARGLFLGTQGALRQVESTFNTTVIERMRQISLTLKTFLNFPQTIGDVGTRILRNTLTFGGIAAILSQLSILQNEQKRIGGGSIALQNANLPVDPQSAAESVGADAIIDLNDLLLEIDIGEAPQETRDELQREVDETVLPRQFYDDTINELERVAANLEDFVGLGSPVLDQIFGRVSTVGSTTGRSATNEEFDLLNAFNLAITGIQDILSTSVLFRNSYADEVEATIAAFAEAIDLQVETATQEVILFQNEYLEDLALRTLADSTRWPEIAILNGLKPPYVTVKPRFAGLDGVLDFAKLTPEEQALFNVSTTVASFGDSILVPAPAFFGLVDIQEGAENVLTAGLTQVEKNLGVDLRINGETYDLILTNGGDLQAIAGAGNMAQAVLTRLRYEKGELLRHPEIGVGLVVGTKARDLNSIRDDIIRSLKQDPRIEDLEDFTVVRDGPSLRLRFRVRIKQVDQPIPLELALPVR